MPFIFVLAVFLIAINLNGNIVAGYLLTLSVIIVTAGILLNGVRESIGVNTSADVSMLI